ncbi:MAG: HU family DNA-binding protein [Candidatus Rokuibacteriota bacterium]
MNRAEIIRRIATTTGWPNAVTDRAVRSMLAGICTALKRGDTITLVGFGTFSAVRRKPRTVRNPKTGRTITVAGGRLPRFRPSKELKQAVR